MKMKNNLDEMQEQNLLYVESKGCWFCFWGLLILIIGQTIIYGKEDIVRYIAGEWIMFMGLSIYMVCGCMKKGIWDRRIKPNIKSNLAMAAITGLVVGVFAAVFNIRLMPDRVGINVLISVFCGVLTFAVCFVLMEIARFVYRKRVEKLEKESDDDETEE